VSTPQGLSGRSTWSAWLWRALELRVLVPLLALALLGLVFMKVASEVHEGDANGLDQWVLMHLRTAAHQPVGPPGLPEVARDLTALGSPAVLCLVTAAACLAMLAAARQAMAWITLGATLSGLGAAMLIKGLFSRSRPDAIDQATVVSGYSFPSGHAMMSAVVYLTVAMMLARLSTRAPMRLTVVTLAALVSVLVGLTRVYLGAHWLSDVIAGWSAGAAWALASWLVAEALGLGRGRRP
jgi:undecaprenyl-diphosphatase